MSSWDEFAMEVKAHLGTRGSECSVAVLLRALPEDGRTAVAKALDDASLSAPAIEKALRARLVGWRVPSQWVINNHRRGDCNCARSA